LISEARKSGIRHIVKLSIMGADLKEDIKSMRLHRQAGKGDKIHEIDYEVGGGKLSYYLPVLNAMIDSFTTLP
jgi:hypothetical protein